MLFKESSFILKLAKFFTNLFNPLFSLLLYFFYVQIKVGDFNEGLKQFLLLFFILILPISFWIYKRVKSGKYSDADVSDRKERKTLYYFIIAALTIYILINYLITNKFETEILYLLFLLIIMQISNLFIKSSMHTALNIYVAALFFAQNHYLGIIWLIISLIVGFTRIILKKHTLQEVISGAIIAIVVSSLFLNFD
ncbi:phosphatase PAP2 family protein [Halpernia sp.]|uniref:phosphatase PAP2 family protein n=1 Tax=Halpernia sp. TaxID=2782209 RepID=UPI003A93BF52